MVELYNHLVLAALYNLPLIMAFVPLVLTITTAAGWTNIPIHWSLLVLPTLYVTCHVVLLLMYHLVINK